MDIREITNKNIYEVVKVHISAFPDFFLTLLGQNFLSLYYKSVLEDKNGVLFGVFEDNLLQGFCAATKQSKGFNKNLILHNLHRFTLEGFKLIFTKPGALIRLIRNFTKVDKKNSDDGNYAELLSIGVNKGSQGKGYGKVMLLELEEKLKQQNIKRISLTTDYYGNDKVIQFYKSCNYNTFYDFITYPNRKMYRLIKNL